MKKIVLRNLPNDIHEFISEKARRGSIDPQEAIVEILRDVALEQAIQHDIDLMKESRAREDDDVVAARVPVCRHRCCHCHCA